MEIEIPIQSLPMMRFREQLNLKSKTNHFSHQDTKRKDPPFSKVCRVQYEKKVSIYGDLLCH